ncbi:MAG: hypothetical protein AAF391_10615 [Bacteroidota bacterium]
MIAAVILAKLLVGDAPKKGKKMAVDKDKLAEKVAPKKVKAEDTAENVFEEDTTQQVEEKTVVEVAANPNTPLDSSARPDDSLPDETYFQTLKNSYLSPIIAKLPEGRSREDVVVRYYKHNMDNKRVYALRSLGYYLHEKEPEDSEDLESNVLYYGKDVDVRDVQLVAYTLLKNGVPLRSIKQSQFDWKSSALEIGTDSLLQENPLLTVSSIRSFER